MHDGLRIDAVEVRIVALPMVEPFVASHGTVAERTLVVVRVIGADGEGWGECAALPEPTYSSEFVDGAFVTITEELAPRLVASDVPARADALATTFGDLVGNHMARAALELALLDAEGRRTHTSLASRVVLHPPGPAPRVRAGVAVGLHDSPDALAAAVRARVEEGYDRIKVKIAPGHDVDPMRAARDAAGTDVILLADANGAYRFDCEPGAPDDARRLTALDDFGLAALEQPLPPDDLLDAAELARRLHTPLALDESLTSPTRVREALDLGACSVVCVKAPMLGSWLAAAEVLDHCAGLGIDAYVGGMVDGGIGRAASIALASHPGASLPGDISATARFFADDVCAPFVVDHRAIAVPTGDGLGVEVDRGALERLTVRSATITR